MVSTTPSLAEAVARVREAGRHYDVCCGDHVPASVQVIGDVIRWHGLDRPHAVIRPANTCTDRHDADPQAAVLDAIARAWGAVDALPDKAYVRAACSMLRSVYINIAGETQ